MGNKAKGDHAPKQPSLDDPRWLSLWEEIDRRVKQTRNEPLAVNGVRLDMARGKLLSMRQNIKTSKREWVAKTFWEDYDIAFYKSAIIIYRRQANATLDEYGNIAVEQVEGWVYFVWQPDSDAPYSGGSSEVAPHPETPKRGGKPLARLKEVLSRLYPDGVPDGTTTQEVLKRIGSEYDKKPGWTVPSRSTVERALGRRK
jgi:hypothetical protein